MATNAFLSLQQHSNYSRVRLTPSAISFHPGGPAVHDDTWIATQNADGTVRLQNTSTGHLRDLAAADVVVVETDLHAPADGLTHLLVTLRRRLAMRGHWAGWLPTRRQRKSLQRATRFR
jgi:hypothetical protein